MDITEKLFSGFEPVSKEQWKAKAIEDLKGAEFDKKLVWRTDDGFSVQPFYTEEDLSQNGLKEQQLSIDSVKRQWINYTQVAVSDLEKANQLASEMVQFGATGILFLIKDPQNIDFEILLNNLDVEKLHISFSTPQPDAAFISKYLRFLEEKQVKLESIKGFYESDVFEHWITKGIEPDFDTLVQLIKTAQIATSFKCLVIKSHAFINAGSNTVQELAFTLNKLTDYIDQLTEKGLPVETIASQIMLHTAIGGDYFFEIAKLRSLKTVLKKILILYGIEVPIEILSSNSVWSKSFYDPNVNMLRNTTEAMSAIVGGCDALLTYPHDSTYAEPSRFSQRVALNISNLLKEESYFDKVVDPAAGSYYIEALTANVTEHALTLFKEVEGKGGFMNAFKAGMIQEQIENVRFKKEKEIASRKRVYVGINKYPNLQEKAALKEIHPATTNNAGISLLIPQHAALSFEMLRNRTINHFKATGFVPKVYLACFGNLAMRKARASFAAEFFGTAGFEIMGEFFFQDAQKAAEDSAQSSADIVVICSSDADYETQAIAFTERFKSLSKEKILVLAGYPEKIVDDLKKSGVDTLIHIKSDAIELLSNFQNQLFTSSLG